MREMFERRVKKSDICEEKLPLFKEESRLLCLVWIMTIRALLVVRLIVLFCMWTVLMAFIKCFVRHVEVPLIMLSLLATHQTEEVFEEKTKCFSFLNKEEPDCFAFLSMDYYTYVLLLLFFALTILCTVYYNQNNSTDHISSFCCYLLHSLFINLNEIYFSCLPQPAVSFTSVEFSSWVMHNICSNWHLCLKLWHYQLASALFVC